MMTYGHLLKIHIVSLTKHVYLFHYYHTNHSWSRGIKIYDVGYDLFCCFMIMLLERGDIIGLCEIRCCDYMLVLNYGKEPLRLIFCSLLDDMVNIYVVMDVIEKIKLLSFEIIELCHQNILY